MLIRDKTKISLKDLFTLYSTVFFVKRYLDALQSGSKFVTPEDLTRAFDSSHGI